MTDQEVQIPQLSELIEEVAALAVEFRRFQETFPDSLVFGRAVGRPLNYTTWQLALRKTEGHYGPDDIVAGKLFIDHLERYSARLEQHYVDCLKKPREFQRFPMVEWILKGRGADWRWQTSTGVQFLAYLDEHRRLLLFKLRDQGTAWHSRFRRLLREAMLKAGDHSIKGAAEEMDVDRGTLGDYLSETRNDLQGPTMMRMRDYIVRHHPAAKEQIRKLFLTRYPR